MLPTHLADLPLRARPLISPPSSRDPSQHVALPIVAFKIHYGCRRRQLAFSSACDCYHGNGQAAMATRRGHIKEEVTHEAVVSSSSGGDVWRYARCSHWGPLYWVQQVVSGCHVESFPLALFIFGINHIISSPPLLCSCGKAQCWIIQPEWLLSMLFVLEHGSVLLVHEHSSM